MNLFSSIETGHSVQRQTQKNPGYKSRRQSQLKKEKGEIKQIFYKKYQRSAKRFWQTVFGKY